MLLNNQRFAVVLLNPGHSRHEDPYSLGHFAGILNRYVRRSFDPYLEAPGKDSRRVAESEPSKAKVLLS